MFTVQRSLTAATPACNKPAAHEALAGKCAETEQTPPRGEKCVGKENTGHGVVQENKFSLVGLSKPTGK